MSEWKSLLAFKDFELDLFKLVSKWCRADTRWLWYQSHQMQKALAPKMLLRGMEPPLLGGGGNQQMRAGDMCVFCR